MPIHLDFDDEWMAEYCRRTGQPNPLDKNSARNIKKSKYKNIKTEADGKVYDSRKEAKRHKELKLMFEAGEILAFAEQVNFRLAKGIVYRADFVVLKSDGTFTIEDTKGVKTKEYKIKKRLLKNIGLEIVEI